MAPRFGTDGIRGIANDDLTPELVMALGRAAARVLGLEGCVVGRDTRRSGAMVVAALEAGLAAEGVLVHDVGVAPTPAIAHLSSELALAAFVISASHNPFPDNGIKVFAPGGVKLDPVAEGAIEAELEALSSHPGGAFGASGEGVGVVEPAAGLLVSYRDHIESVLDHRTLEGLSVVLDCANGAASGVAPEIFRRLGATVEVLSASPDGININAGCGSTYPAGVASAVVDLGADMGLAFDGDADRLVAVGHDGTVVDGDQLLALFAPDMRASGRLKGDKVAVTVMSNLGFHLSMADQGIGVVETPVGDRNVLEAIESAGLALGGEQSGHIIFRDLATTGDGILTGVLLADLVLRSGSSLGELALKSMVRLPQRLMNVKVPLPDRLAEAPGVWEEVERVRAHLGRTGRVLLRASGTEPLVRVMVEASTQAEADASATRLCDAVCAALDGAVIP